MLKGVTVPRPVKTIGMSRRSTVAAMTGIGEGGSAASDAWF